MPNTKDILEEFDNLFKDSVYFIPKNIANGEVVTCERAENKIKQFIISKLKEQLEEIRNEIINNTFISNDQMKTVRIINNKLKELN